MARIQRQPDVAQYIRELRAEFCEQSHARLSQLAPKAWDMADETVSLRDTKGFDSTIRGLVSMERISANVAGVPKQVSIDGPSVIQNIDVKAIIGQLFAD